MKIIVSHPGKQHSYKTAEALDSKNRLLYYITSVYTMPGRLTHMLYLMARGSMKKKIGSHYINGISKAKVKIFCEFRGVFALLLTKFPRLKKKYQKCNDVLNDAFGLKVAKFAIRVQADAVISYDNNSNSLFDALERKAPHIVRILDVSIASRPFMKEIFLRDYEKTKDDELKHQLIDPLTESVIVRARDEIKKAQYFLAPSEVVKKSLVFCGADESKIKIVPYGVDCSKFSFSFREAHEGPLRLIFVGAVDYRKGIHHLLNVISSFPPDTVDVNLVGAYDSNGALYKKYKDNKNVHFCGFATHDVLVALYHKSDVFVFPTLGEGYGMVLLEAMSCGLPVIVSSLAGGNDAVTDGVDGFEFEGGNEAQLLEKIQWFLDHKSELPHMGRMARQAAERHTWDVYSRDLNKAIEEIMNEKNENTNLCNT